MNRTIDYLITEKENPTSIREFLKKRGYSRQILIHLKQTPASVLRNDVPAMLYQTLHDGDRLRIFLADEESSEKIRPVPLPLSIVYEDEDLLVINKPADMPVHPSIGNYENTLANAVAWYYETRQMPFVFRCINRLDRDTTGLLVLAKNPLSAAVLSQQMRERSIRRTYLAIVEGITEESGTIRLPIGRSHSSLIERQVDYENGEAAVTHYRRLATRPPKNAADSPMQGEMTSETLPATDCFPRGLSLVELHLETGRTHQIRVHMTAIGHPLPGDTLYNPATQLMKRQALHSQKLAFKHPVTGEPLSFTAPLPEDMRFFFPAFSD